MSASFKIHKEVFVLCLALAEYHELNVVIVNEAISNVTNKVKPLMGSKTGYDSNERKGNLTRGERQ